MRDLVLTQTTLSDGQRALASASVVNWPAPVGRAAVAIGAGAGFGSVACTGAGAGAAAGAGAGAAAAGAAGVAAAFWARQDLRNSCQVCPFVALFALAAFHSSPHCFIMLCARAPPVVARPTAAATRKAENAALNDLIFMSAPSVRCGDWGQGRSSWP